MMKLPVCPYCNTIYRYGDIKKIINNKNSDCYHCKKKFKIIKKNILIMFAAIILITAIVDCFELFVMSGTNFITLMITNIIALAIGFFITPYFVRFKKII